MDITPLRRQAAYRRQGRDAHPADAAGNEECLIGALADRLCSLPETGPPIPSADGEAEQVAGVTA